jgi:bacterioferritin (cytochrome b1)
MSTVKKDVIEFSGEQFKLQIKDRVNELLAKEREAQQRIREQIEKFTKSGNTFKLNLYQSKLADSEKKIRDLEKMLQ